VKTRYDRKADALYVRFSDAKIEESEELRPGVIFDFDAEDRIVGIEILDVRKQMPPDAFADLRATE
jgi:uncharacterized protein YuzE